MWKIRRGYLIVLSLALIIAIVNILQVGSAKRALANESDQRFVRDANLWLEEQQTQQETLVQQKRQTSSMPFGNDKREGLAKESFTDLCKPATRSGPCKNL